MLGPEKLPFKPILGNNFLSYRGPQRMLEIIRASAFTGFQHSRVVLLVKSFACVLESHSCRSIAEFIWP